jgi:uncharacterized repeat protein (TIGR03803 family)
MRHITLALALLLAIVTSIATPAQTVIKLADFSGAGGFQPGDGFIQGKDGYFYCTTRIGGNGHGTVSKISPQGTITALYSFTGADDGFWPVSGVMQAVDGNFYGTTPLGGQNGGGTVFKVSPDGVFTTLYSFSSFGNGGSSPYAGLLQASDGNLYGATLGNGYGTLYKITTDGELTTLYTFGGADGSQPYARLVQGSDGDLYGSTTRGGANDNGTIFKVTFAGKLTTLHSFSGPDGSYPLGIVQGADGNFYGLTQDGGSGTYGTVFKMTPEGALTTLYTFCSQSGCPDGYWPFGGLLQAIDGAFYGTTEGGGGRDSFGTLFRITSSGTLTTLHSFNSIDGSLPYGPPAQAGDGTLYGTAGYGGSYDGGTVYRLLTYLLSVAKSGMGTVSAGGGNLYCGMTCRYTYDVGSVVTLSAMPMAGYTFTGWTGCDNVKGSFCSVTMTGAKNISATFTTANVTLTSLTFKPMYIRRGQLSAGTLTLNAPAPPGGVTVALSSDHPAVAHPPSFVFVPGGKSSIGFAVNTFPVKTSTTASITATAGSSHVGGTLTVGTTALPQSIK